ncbi:MAG: P1 family peptidase, partial [Candidatus Brocadiia bacterium]|nr:P1 family peptidase [Candidatus Brocadiia bacterium]
MPGNAITDVPGISVGNYTDTESATGCTVVLCGPGAVAGVDVRGSAPGTRGTDLLRPTTLVAEAYAVLLTGGSGFGLDAASGVMRFLEERGIGLRFGGGTVPTVAGAVLFDLGLITAAVRPGPDEGYQACLDASSSTVPEGSVGAGTGATVGKLLGAERAMKGGIGTASVALDDGLVVGAIVAVNALGDVVDPDTGVLVAGPRGEDGAMLRSLRLLTSPGFKREDQSRAQNTTIGVVATNARITTEQVSRLATVG